jgi:hypothetical protein
MADKELLEIIADMLRKLDQHSETLELQNKALQEQGEALTSFMDGSLKQFDQQQIFNEKLLKMNNKIVDRLEILEAKMNQH